MAVIDLNNLVDCKLFPTFSGLNIVACSARETRGASFGTYVVLLYKLNLDHTGFISQSDSLMKTIGALFHVIKLVSCQLFLSRRERSKSRNIL